MDTEAFAVNLLAAQEGMSEEEKAVFTRNRKAHIGGFLMCDDKIGKFHVEVDRNIALKTDGMSDEYGA